MSKPSTPGRRLRAALATQSPLQLTGVINAYAAILAANAGFKALYVSGAGVANASLGIPDVGLTTLEDVLTDVRRIAQATPLPVVVDGDTGWNDPARTVRELVKAGAAAVHLEDQVEAKRCGHLGGKKLVATAVMARRLKAAIRGRTDPSFVIIARTDAAATEGLEGAIERGCHYRDAGADMIFAEALTDLTQYRQFVQRVRIPILANITEFGKTPLFTLQQLRSAGVAVALYPLSAFRAMNAAAMNVFRTIHSAGSQKDALDNMQTRAELYEFLRYDPKSKKAWRRD